jgi:phosphatidylinositol glycan class W
MLSNLGVADYILNAPRLNFFSQNKEGIISSLGYSSLFLIGAYLGNKLLAPKKKLSDWNNLCILLAILGVGSWVLANASNQYLQPFSRRMVNFSYCMAILHLCSLGLAGFLAIDLVTKPVPNSVLSSLNKNGLAMFLLANISTGLVNLLIPTLYIGDFMAFCILFCYLFFVCTVAFVLDVKQITLKFW